MAATSEKRQQAVAKIEQLPESEQLAVLDALIEKRKQKQFIKYFDPWNEQREALKHFTGATKIWGLLGGNRSGKTILGAFIAVAWALGKDYFKDEPAWEWVKDLPIPPPPNNIWVVGVGFDVLRDVIWYEKLRHGKAHPPFVPDDGSVRKFSDGDFQVFFNNGSLLTGKSADAGREKFQSASIDLVWIDEECEKDIFNECFQRTLDCAGKILLTLTPLTDINSGVREPWVFDLYEESKGGGANSVFCQLSTLNSPFISAEEKEQIIAKWKGDPEEEARLYGKFVRRSGLVYPQFDRNLFLRPLSDIPKHWVRVVSIDPAATGITAALWLAVNPDGDYYAHREYYERDRTVSEHAKSIKILCGGDPVDYWFLDPYWGRQRNAETHKTGDQLYRENGIPVRLPQFHPDYPVSISREYFNATVQSNSRFPKFYITDGLPNLEDELRHYTWDSYSKGDQKGLSKEKPRKRNDHLINCLQYAMTMRLKAHKKPQDFFSQGEERTPQQRAKLVSYT